MKKIMTRISIVLMAAAVLAFIATGFRPRTDVALYDFVLSEDGRTMTMKTTLTTPMGHTRAVKYETIGDTVFCSFRQTFGGPFLALGSRDEFAVRLDGTENRISFDRGNCSDQVVLVRDENSGEWRMPERK